MLVEPVSDAELDELLERIESGRPMVKDKWNEQEFTHELILRLAIALRRARLGGGVY